MSQNKFSGISDTLEKLVKIHSPSGKEQEIFELFCNIAEKYGLKSWTDGRNAYVSVGKLNNKKPTLLISAHGDEVGMVVSGFTDDGFIRISAFNGFTKVLPGLEVVIKGKKDILGVIGCKPPHLLKPGEMKKIIPTDQLFVDTGLPRNEIIENISVGDSVLYKKRFHKLQNNRIAASAVDNKISVTILLELGRRLSKIMLDLNVVLVCASTEEIGSQGASHAFREINPDYAISLDTMSSNQFNHKTPFDVDISDGIMIANGALLNKSMYKNLKQVADKLSIKTKNFVFDGGGGDSGRFIHTDLGCRTAGVFIPIRYLHQPIEVFDLQTAHDCVHILEEFVRGLPCSLKGVV